MLTRWSHHWRRWRALEPLQRQVFFWASVQLPWYWILLRIRSLPKLHAGLRQVLKRVGRQCVPHEEVVQIAEAVNMAAAHSPFPRTCLTRSLVLLKLLAQRGVEAELRVGVRLLSGKLDAHAWVEHEGVPVNDRAAIASDYAAFDDLGQSLAFHTP